MDKIKIRLATTSEPDLNGIANIHRKEEHIPWNNDDKILFIIILSVDNPHLMLYNMLNP
ncbi:MAG: hypothetical protein FWG34_04920 [Oscillospiraceae bacterium]|nr:hypothetical protein [Oscillospiraceae bacterium]